MKSEEELLGRVEWPKKAVIDLIEIWQQHEYLYNRNHRLYGNKKSRHNAINTIAQTLKKHIPNLQGSDVKTKMNYLRGQYSKEISKEKESRKNGIFSDELYEPSAYWFEKLHFLRKFIKIRNDTNYLNEHSKFENFENLYLDDFKMSDDDTIICLPQSYEPPKIKRRIESLSNASVITELNDFIPRTETPSTTSTTSLSTNILNISKTSIREDVESFVNHIKLEINKITNDELQDELQNRIENLIFEFKVKQRKIN